MNKFMSRKAGSQAEPDQGLPGGKFSAGKKLLLAIPFVVLLAAGCSSSSTNNNNSQTGQSNTPPASQTTASSSMASDKSQSAMSASVSASSTWQATLQLSNNGAKGHYMITTGGHTIYLKSSRDYSSLVGKPVNVSYNGSLDSFTLVNITAQ